MPIKPNKLFGRVSLRTILIIPFILKIFTAVGLVGYLSYRNGQKAMQDLAEQLQQEIADRLSIQLDSYLAQSKYIMTNLQLSIGFMSFSQV